MGTVKYSGPVASFHCPTNAEIRSLKVHFSPKQGGSGDPSPENVREIVGWDGVEVRQSGKNLFPSDISFYEFPTTAWTSSSMSSDFVFANGEYSGTVPAGKRDWTVMITKHTFAPGTYTISFDYINGVESTTWQPVILTYHNGGGWYSGLVGLQAVNDASGHKEKTFTATEPFYISLSLHSFGNTTKEGFNKIYNLQLEKNSTTTAYEPYHGSTTNYEFGVLGKNKLDKSQCIDDYRIGKTDGRNYSDAGYYISPFIPVSVGMSYTKNSPTIDAYHRFATYSEANTDSFIRILDNSNTITIEEGEKFLRFCGILSEKDTVQLELGSSATAYEPYDPKHTVYGGWVDLISGEVCEEWYNVDPSKWIKYNESNGYYAYRLDGYPSAEAYSPTAGIQKLSNMISQYGSFNSSNMNKNIIQYPNYLALQQDISVETVEYIYKLATPITYQLPATSMQTFLAQNNIWSNADYVEVEYDLHETQTILARKQFIIANQPHVVKPAAAPLQNFVTDMKVPLKECKVEFKPIQDLHGYDKPWIGGSGKNLLNANLFVKTSTITGNDLTISDETITMTWVNGAIIGNNRGNQSFPAGTYTISATGTNANLIYARMDAADRSETIATANLGGSKSFTAEKEFYVNLYGAYNNHNTAVFKLQLESGSAATAWTPYSNICPISGWTGVNVTRCGKNLFNLADYEAAGWTKVDDAEYPDTYTGKKISFTTLRGRISDAAENNDSLGLLSKRMPLGQVVFSWYDYNTSNWRTYFHYDGDSAWTKHTGNIQTVGLKTYLSNSAKNCDGVALYTTQSVSASGQIGRVMIERGTTATDYEPYNGITVNIDWTDVAGTVYGGYVDLVTGEVWETHHKIILDGVTTNCKANRDYSDSTNIIGGVVYLQPMGEADGQFSTKLLCDSMPILAPSEALPTDYPFIRTISAGGQYLRIYVAATAEHSDLDTTAKRIAFVNEYLAEHPTTVVYPLATPTLVTTLTPTALRTLIGTNNIWANNNGSNIQIKFWTH